MNNTINKINIIDNLLNYYYPNRDIFIILNRDAKKLKKNKLNFNDYLNKYIR
jgi:hypothetical protein